MTPLLARLEAASEGSRALDELIAQAVYPELGFGTKGDNKWYMHDVHVRIEDYTTSLDAALTLVPEGWAWDLMAWPDEPSEAAICKPGSPHLGRWKAATPALALVIACLRARA